MNAHQCLRVGILLLAIGGCNSTQPKTASTSTPNKDFTPQPQQTAEEPKWETPGQPAPDLLAQKTAAYANSLQGSDPTDKDASPDGSAALFDKPGGHRHRGQNPFEAQPAAQAPPVVAPPVVVVPPPPVPAAQLASAQISPVPAVKNDEPKIMPESADFASTGPSKDVLGDRLRKRTRDNPADVADQLDLQLYGMLNDDPAPELAEVTLLTNDDREIVSALVDGISNFRSAIRQDSTMLQAKKIQPLLDMADRLRSQADLTVSTVVLCRRVMGYGNYEPITPTRFPAGKENRVIVYCEVANFLAKQNSQQMWEAKMSEQVTLYTDAGMMAWTGGTNQLTDECRNRRHDFFCYNLIQLPPNLTVGRYMLKVSIEDQNAGRVAETTVPLSIAAN